MPRDEETRWKREFPWDIFEKLSKKGYPGAGIPKEYGGLGATGACIAAEALNRMPGARPSLCWKHVGRAKADY
jgi:alkylation response protein AidB-like acyl-CoA dehydrogenase